MMPGRDRKLSHSPAYIVTLILLFPTTADECYSSRRDPFLERVNLRKIGIYRSRIAPETAGAIPDVSTRR
jgi:hypothetical protein